MRESDGLRAEMETLRSAKSADDVNCYDDGYGIDEEGIPSVTAGDIMKTANVAAQGKSLELKYRGNISPNFNLKAVVALDSQSVSESGSCDSNRHEDTTFSSLSVTQEYIQPAYLVSKINLSLSTSTWSVEHDDKRITLAVAGMIEAISVLRCSNTTQSRYETAMTDKSRKSLLQHGRAMISAEEWVKYESTGGVYHLGDELLSAAVVEVLPIFVHAQWLSEVQSVMRLSSKLFIRQILLFHIINIFLYCRSWVI